MKRSSIFMSISFVLAIAAAMVSKADTKLIDAWKNPGCAIDTRPPFCNTTGVFTCTVSGSIYFRDNFCLVEYKKNTP